MRIVLWELWNVALNLWYENPVEDGHSLCAAENNFSQPFISRLSLHGSSMQPH